MVAITLKTLLFVIVGVWFLLLIITEIAAGAEGTWHNRNRNGDGFRKEP